MVCYDEEFVNASHLEMTEDMHSRTPIIHLTTGRNASKAMPIQFAHWQLIDWERARCIVKKLQRRIVKAVLIMAASSHLRLSMLERYEAKVSRTVLRGGRGSNPPDLPDFLATAQPCPSGRRGRSVLIFNPYGQKINLTQLTEDSLK